MLTSLLCAVSLLQGTPTKQYAITLRVIVPVLKKIPTVAEFQSNMKRYNFLDAQIHLKSKTPEKQDEEILGRLRKQFSLFQFPKIIKRHSFTFNADTLWSAPKDFCMHDITLAIIQNNPKLMDDKAASPPTKPEPAGIRAVPKTTTFFLSHRYPPATLKRMTEEGKLLLYLNARWSCVENKRKYVFLSGKGPYELENNITTCINPNQRNMLETSEDKSKKVIITSTELVVMSIKEITK
jgi:hypothetical protein